MSYGYVPAPLPPPLLQRPSWFSRNWKWFIPTIIVVPILLIVLLIGGLFVIGMSAIRSSESYQHAVAAATHNRHVIEKLGTPVTPGWYILGTIHLSDSAGDADMGIPLNGTVRHGTVHVVARKWTGIWTYQRLDVQIDSEEERINLMPSPPTTEEK